MATIKFSKVKIGATFYANGGNGYEQYKKVSDLEYESVQNSILGSFYATPGFEVETEAPAAPKAATKKKPGPKPGVKSVKKTNSTISQAKR